MERKEPVRWSHVHISACSRRNDKFSTPLAFSGGIKKTTINHRDVNTFLFKKYLIQKLTKWCSIYIDRKYCWENRRYHDQIVIVVVGYDAIHPGCRASTIRIDVGNNSSNK